jgi:hypothetical protein
MLPVIASIVSNLISNGMHKVAEQVIEKGVDAVQEKLGIELKPEGQATPEYNAKLQEEANKHEEFMAALDAKDRADARDREIQIATNDKAPTINKVVTPIIALGVLSLAFVLFGIIIFIDVRPEAKDILIYVLGVLSAAVTQILSYYFGSSQGSKEKNDQLKQALNGGGK